MQPLAPPDGREVGKTLFSPTYLVNGRRSTFVSPCAGTPPDIRRQLRCPKTAAPGPRSTSRASSSTSPWRPGLLGSGASASTRARDSSTSISGRHGAGASGSRSERSTCAVETPPAREVLAESRTLKGGGAAGVATIGAAGIEVAQEVLAETQGAILPLVPYLSTRCAGCSSRSRWPASRPQCTRGWTTGNRAGDDRQPPAVSSLAEMLSDHAVMRDQARACRAG